MLSSLNEYTWTLCILWSCQWSCLVVSCRVVSCLVVSCRVVLCLVVSRRVVLFVPRFSGTAGWGWRWAVWWTRPDQRDRWSPPTNHRPAGSWEVTGGRGGETGVHTHSAVVHHSRASDGTNSESDLLFPSSIHFKIVKKIFWACRTAGALMPLKHLFSVALLKR